ncbi:MAG: hypothetical protein OXG15_14905 [Gammaproteobacteria bacterium]|nr:hypothetical protein [Gammaproteobacteria bacterium]
MLKAVSNLQTALTGIVRLDAFNTNSVATLIPKGFERYARIFHPCWRIEGRSRIHKSTSWREITERTGTVAHASMQWEKIFVSSVFDDEIRPPDEGLIPRVVSVPLKETLTRHTNHRDCWLAVWVGWGWDYFEHVPRTQKIGIHGGSGRIYDLFRAPLSMIDTRFFTVTDKNVVVFKSWGWTDKLDERIPEFAPLSRSKTVIDNTANIVWADDLSWWLMVDIDLDTTYIGGNSRLIDELLTNPELEVWEVQPEDGVGIDSDKVNTRSSV